MHSANLDFCGIINLLKALVISNACTEEEAQKVARRLASKMGADIILTI